MTVFDLIEKVAVVLPAGIVTVVGGVADGVLLESPTTIPPVGAGELIVTVPTLLAPPLTEVGFRERLVRVGGWIVSVVVIDTAPSFALRVTDV